jgi:hypothetical protein
MERKAFFINEINLSHYCTTSPLFEAYSRREGVPIACPCLNTEGSATFAEYSTVTMPSKNIREVMYDVKLNI